MHHVFTFTAEVITGRASALKTALASVAPGLPGLLETLGSLHFASLLIVPESGTFPSYLVFENNIDGTIDAYIEQLCTSAPVARALDTMFSNCVGYAAATPAGATSSATAPDVVRLRTYLREKVVRPNTSFVGNVGRTVARIRDEWTLVDKIEKQIDALVGKTPTATPQDLYNSVRSAIAAGSSWALQPKRNVSARDMWSRRLSFWALVPGALLGLFLAPLDAILILRRIRGSMPPFSVTLSLLVAPLAAIVGVLLRHEIADKPNGAPMRPQDLMRVTQREDTTLSEDQRIDQNHFASVSVVKPGRFRRYLLRAVLFVMDRKAAASVNGTLSDLDNIHFAQWVLLDGGRRLLFLTNYDGSWENYLDDFIDRAASGLTAIWSNTIGFPKTWLLIWGGARNERQFKNAARRTQIPAAVWYSAYPHYTVTSIQNNTEIRNGLATPPRGSAVQTWLQRL
jgi:hypothetical protein